MAKRNTVEQRQTANMSPVVAIQNGAHGMNEYPLTEEEFTFIQAINAYKRQTGKPFPSWTEVLHVLKSLGYQKQHKEV